VVGGQVNDEPQWLLDLADLMPLIKAMEEGEHAAKVAVARLLSEREAMDRMRHPSMSPGECVLTPEERAEADRLLASVEES
jgi:hypothetical protein